MMTKIIAWFAVLLILPPFPFLDKKEIDPIEHWAVLIGINSYKWGVLPYSIKEVEEFREVLLSNRLMWKDSHILLVKDARKEDVINAIDWLSKHADDNDVSIFYFVGHGCRNLTNEFISTIDGRISDIELDGYLDEIKGKMVVIIDACHSGGFIEDLKQKNRIVITACKKDERTYQIKDLENGLFGYFFIACLKYLTKSAEFTFYIANVMIRYYSSKLSRETNKSYYVHPQMYDGTKGLIYIIYHHPYLTHFKSIEALFQSKFTREVIRCKRFAS